MMNMTDAEVIAMMIDFWNIVTDEDEKIFIKKYGQKEYDELSSAGESEVKIRHEMYHDVYVYPDGREEWVSIGD